jgi:hypothetical protein
MSHPVTIDVAHPPRRPEAVEEDLHRAVTRIRNSPDLHVLKIVHGYGSGGKGGSTKENTQNWLFRNRFRFRAIIQGNEYELHNPVVQEMMRESGQFADADLGAGNPGVTVVWVR